jgi:hypothetical protein
VEGLAADLDVHAEVRAHVEGRVDVDELEAARVFDLATERATFERGKNELVVAPDEFVGPAFDLPPADVEAEFFLFALFLPRLIDVFKRLEGKDGRADLAGFAIPDEFHLALLGVGEVVSFGVVWACHISAITLSLTLF